MVLSFVQSIILQLEISPNKTRIGLVYFSNTPYLGFSLNRYTNQQDVIQGVLGIPYVGMYTDLGAALNYLTDNMYNVSNGGRPSAEHMAIFITDAVSTLDGSDTVPAGIAAKIAGIEIVTVVVGQPAFVDMGSAADIASDPPSRNIVNITSYYSLPNITDKIIDATCNNINECASNPCMAGGKCVEGYGVYNCICPMSATGYNCQSTCSMQMNLIFVLDLAAGSLYYDMIIAFVKQVIYGVDVTNDQVRVGVVTYATQVGDFFYPGAYTRNRQDLIYAIDFNDNGGLTNTQAALQFVLSNELLPANGALTGVPNVIIVVTDGNSNVLQGSPGATAAKQLLQTGATIYAVGYGQNPNLSELDAIGGSNSGKQNVFMIASANATDINAAAAAVLQELC
jgi:collagen type VI alpha